MLCACNMMYIQRPSLARLPALTVNNAISRPEELVVARWASLCVDRDLLVGHHGRGELDPEVWYLAHDDLLQEHPAGRER